MTSAGEPGVTGRDDRPSSGRASATPRTLPRRFTTPIRGAGAPGTAVTASSMITSRASRTSTANGRPPRVTRQARLRETASTGGTSGGGAGAASGVAAIASFCKALHHREQLIGGERLAEVLVGSLPLAPGPVALLVLAAHEHHRSRLRASVLAERSQDLVAVALRHHDVEQQHIGALARQFVLQGLAVQQGDDLVPGGLQNRLHELELRNRVVH